MSDQTRLLVLLIIWTSRELS